MNPTRLESTWTPPYGLSPLRIHQKKKKFAPEGGRFGERVGVIVAVGERERFKGVWEYKADLAFFSLLCIERAKEKKKESNGECDCVVEVVC